MDLDITKCLREWEGLSAEQIVEFAKQNFINSQDIDYSNCDKCEGKEIEKGAFYCASNNDLTVNEYFSCYDDAQEKYEDREDINIFEVEIYLCEKCGAWDVDCTCQ